MTEDGDGVELKIAAWLFENSKGMGEVELFDPRNSDIVKHKEGTIDELVRRDDAERAIKKAERRATEEAVDEIRKDEEIKKDLQCQRFLNLIDERIEELEEIIEREPGISKPHATKIKKNELEKLRGDLEDKVKKE